jgi:maltose/maltodextrin transport system permease protein
MSAIKATMFAGKHAASSEGRVRWLRSVCLALALALALYGVVAVYAMGEILLAVVLLVLVAVAAWVFTSPRLMHWRYLYPGIAAALVFVVFPMVYTIATAFTNYSSKNLLDEARARESLLEETFDGVGPTLDFSMQRSGNGWQLNLTDPASNVRYASPVISLSGAAAQSIELKSAATATASAESQHPAAPIRDVIAALPALKKLVLKLPDGALVRLKSLREFGPSLPLYTALSDGGLKNQETGTVLHANLKTGFFEDAKGVQYKPGFAVGVGLKHFAYIFTDSKFSEPFVNIFVWTVIFAALTVVFTAALGMLLAVLLNWPALQGKAVYRLILFLPYAVPGFISILIFKGLFNQNLGEINLILKALFGISPSWFSDPTMAKAMLLIVNTWLGFPYMMIICTGLIKSIPEDLYEASAILGAGPIANFFYVTLPLVIKPLTPLLIAAFAFNFNNFVLISLLTDGRPDFLDTSVPAGTTDILVSYTWRIAFQDSGQQFGLAAAISTVIFLLVAAITLVQMRLTRSTDAQAGSH